MHLYQNAKLALVITNTSIQVKTEIFIILFFEKNIDEIC
jgi:hypothetical protein